MAEETAVLHDVDVDVWHTSRVIRRIRHVHERRKGQTRLIGFDDLEVIDLRPNFLQPIIGTITVAGARRARNSCGEICLSYSILYLHTTKKEVKTYA